jgi:hypothetical protein
VSKLDWEELLYFWELAIRREQEIDNEEELISIESMMESVYYRNPEWIREAMNDVGSLLNKWEDILKEKS